MQDACPVWWARGSAQCGCMVCAGFALEQTLGRLHAPCV